MSSGVRSRSLRYVLQARPVRMRLAGATIAALALTSCGGTTTATIAAHIAAKRARWVAFVHVKGPLDLAGPRRDGSVVLAAAGRLWLLTRKAQVQPFAPSYSSPGGTEPYIALSPGGCFGSGTVYALHLVANRGVVAITAHHGVRRLTTIKTPGLLDGIAFDQTGGFEHRLLVTVTAHARTTVDAIDCHGMVTTITRRAPRVEGGLAVAPQTFGRFAGDLIAPDEKSGRLYAITPHGRSLVVVNSGLPHGQDIGVESEAFVPAGRRDALVSDRLTPGNPHPGDNVVLRLRAAALKAAGVLPGDLLVASEGGALTDALRCTISGCQVRFVAAGPAVAHIEGHVAFVPMP